jgi:dihydrofolate synthase / folylpolyglutamate synthase
MPSEAEAWVSSLSPWPKEGFGLERMRSLLAMLDDPQEAYEAVHVVGTNGKSTAALTVEALLLAEGLHVGTTISPHVRSWSERIRVGGEEADFGDAIERVRPAAEELGATQFETITAAALARFAAAGIDVAVVEAGLGGRFDATNVLRTRVVLLTNVGHDHTDVLGQTLDEIAAEKLAVAHPSSIVVLSDNRWAGLVPDSEVRLGGALQAAEALVGRPIDFEPTVQLPGRFEVRGEQPLEIWDGAHNPEGVAHLLDRLPERDFVLVASILPDGKDARGMLRALARRATTLVATASSNPRALPAQGLARIAPDFSCTPGFRSVEVISDPHRALERARSLAGPDGAVLVTGSLYLLADLFAAERQEAWHG